MSSLPLKIERVSWNRLDTTTWTSYHQSGQEYQVFDTEISTLPKLITSALKFGDKEFLVDEQGKKLSFSQAIESAKKLAVAIKDSKLCNAGDRIGVCGRNSIDWIISFMGICLSGCTVIPMNSWWTSKELQFAINHTDCKLIFADQERSKRISSASWENKRIHIVFMDASTSDYQMNPNPNIIVLGDFQSFLGNSSSSNYIEPQIKQDQRAMIIFTSGTTNFPKGVVSTHRGVIHGTLSLAAQRLLIVDKAACLLTVPLFHVTGLHAIFLASLVLGRKIVVLRKWNPERALELIERERVTSITGVPTMVMQLLTSPDLSKRDISSLTNVGSGGASAPAMLAKSIKEKMKSTGRQGYGLTETNAVVSSIIGEDYLTRPTSCGKPYPGVQVQIWSDEEDFKELPKGQTGRIVVKGPNVMLEYWKDSVATEKALTENGWFKSGVS